MSAKSQKPSGEMTGIAIVVPGESGKPSFSGVGFFCSCECGSFHLAFFHKRLQIRCTKCESTWSFNAEQLVRMGDQAGEQARSE